MALDFNEFPQKCRLAVISDDEADLIHGQALELLEHYGLFIEHEEARRLLREAGAQTDGGRGMVRFPPSLVQECLGRVPRRITYGARDPAADLFFQTGGRVYCRSISGLELYLDPRTGERRRATGKDVRDWAVLNDALPRLDYVAVLHPTDAPLPTREIHAAAATVRATTKHVHLSGVAPRNMKALWEITCLIQGGEEQARRRPLFSILESVVSPLLLKGLAAEIILACGEYGIPIELNSSPIIGATGPVTLAGSLLLSHAEILGALTLHQVAHPGAPVLYAPRLLCLDMRRGFGATGAVEGVLTAAAGVQLARRCGDLLTNFYGPFTDAFREGDQSTLERTLMTVMPLLAGVHSLAGAGGLESCSLAGPVQLVEDDELLGILARLMRGIAISPETLALEVIEKVGPMGNYLPEEHTLRHHRRELHAPGLLNRMLREAWVEEGARTMTDLARERALTLINEHRPAPLEESVSRELDRLLAAVDRQAGFG